MSQDNRGCLRAGRAEVVEHLVLGWKFHSGTSPLPECPPAEPVNFKVRTASAPPAVLSCPAAVRVTGIPGRRGGEAL